MEKVEFKTQAETSTLSSDDQKNNCSKIRLISSEYLTAEMAVRYLYQWRNDERIVQHLLNRLHQFCICGYYHLIPFIVFIISLHPTVQLQIFFHKLANHCLPLYLTIRWSYITYMGPEKLTIIQKLDSSLIKRCKESDLKDLNDEQIMQKIEAKVKLSNYLSAVNDFFQKLFGLPLKLKKTDDENRSKKLRYYLERIFNSFSKDNQNYINGIIFPIESSSVVVSIAYEFCRVFSTREREPFKLIVEMISFQEALRKVNICDKSFYLSQQTKNQSQLPRQLLLPHTYFGEQWQSILNKVSSESEYKQCPSYTIRSFMVKSGDDFRQEYLAMQLIKLIHSIIERQNLKIWIKPYMVIPFSSSSGLIQFLNDTQTISYLKQISHEKSLKKIYKQIFGRDEDTALTNFTQSLAGYSLIQYLFQIKDRHNKNILIDSQGHIIHIDFSFIISSSPGNMGFQQAPFKLTQDYLDIMEGFNSDLLIYFKSLFTLGLKYIRKYKKQIIQMILMMKDSELQCFRNFDPNSLDKRFHLSATDQQLELIVENIIKNAYNSYTTSQYDAYQWYTNFIYS